MKMCSQKPDRTLEDGQICNKFIVCVYVRARVCVYVCTIKSKRGGEEERIARRRKEHNKSEV
jgi:hypothetical protein